MNSSTLINLLSSDSRFVKSGTKLYSLASELSELFSHERVSSKFSSSFSCARNAVSFLNLIQYANEQNDSLIERKFSEDDIVSIMDSGISYLDYDLLDSDLKEFLKDDFLDFRNLSSFDSKEISREAFIQRLVNKQQKDDVLPDNGDGLEISEEFWVNSIRLDHAFIPQFNYDSLLDSFSYGGNNYAIYTESSLPSLQSQINLTTKLEKFKNSDLMKLFPPIRLYTRSPYMYSKYDSLEYDDDLGCIFPISGYTRDEIMQNLVEFPHLEFLDRVVKSKGKEYTLPFWKHIEIEGEIYLTSSVWDELQDTKYLPKTESFMNEYVVRKYILDLNSGKPIKYMMRGDISPFLTLYAPASYYERKGYDPVEIAKKCVTSRIKFKETRNPVMNLRKELMNRDSMSLQ